jgi:hypothetical protein
MADFIPFPTFVDDKREGPAKKRNGRLSKDYGTVKSREGGR